MTTTPPHLWEALEPLLGRVAKPTRFIGCDLGAVESRRGSGKVAGPWRYATMPFISMAECAG